MARQESLDQDGQVFGQRTGMLADVGRRIAAMTAEGLSERARRIGESARQHLEKHDSQAEQIAAQVICRLGPAQFRSEVVGCAQDVALAE